MTSKYDDYWAGQLPRIRTQLQLAAAGTPARVDVPGLPLLGARQSWHGVAEVRARDVTYSSMAHATSLGKTVAASGICAQWPERAFRFTVRADGAVLTITAAAGHPRRQAPPASGPGTARPQERWQPVPQAQPAGRDRVPAAGGGPSDADMFYRILDRLAARLGGPWRLHDYADGSAGRRRASISSTKTARTARPAACALCASAPTR